MCIFRIRRRKLVSSCWSKNGWRNVQNRKAGCGILCGITVQICFTSKEGSKKKKVRSIFFCGCRFNLTVLYFTYLQLCVCAEELLATWTKILQTHLKIVRWFPFWGSQSCNLVVDDDNDVLVFFFMYIYIYYIYLSAHLFICITSYIQRGLYPRKKDIPHSKS